MGISTDLLSQEGCQNRRSADYNIGSEFLDNRSAQFSSRRGAALNSPKPLPRACWSCYWPGQSSQRRVGSRPGLPPDPRAQVRAPSCTRKRFSPTLRFPPSMLARETKECKRKRCISTFSSVSGHHPCQARHYAWSCWYYNAQC